MNVKLRFILCKFAIPILRLVLNQVKDEISRSPNPYDDVVLEVVVSVIEIVEKHFCDFQVNKG